MSIDERELSDAERAYCNEHMMYSDTESVVEFSIPHPEELQAAIADQDLSHLHCLEAVISDHERRHDVLTEFQERIKDVRVLANQFQQNI